MKTIFRVPHEPALRAKWVEQIRRHQAFDDAPISYPVCILHFHASKINRSGKRTTLTKGSLPTIYPR